MPRIKWVLPHEALVMVVPEFAGAATGVGWTKGAQPTGHSLAVCREATISHLMERYRSLEPVIGQTEEAVIDLSEIPAELAALIGRLPADRSEAETIFPCPDVDNRVVTTAISNPFKERDSSGGTGAPSEQPPALVYVNLGSADPGTGEPREQPRTPAAGGSVTSDLKLACPNCGHLLRMASVILEKSS